MNKKYHFIFYALLVFLLTTVAITIWYVMAIGSSVPNISMLSIKEVAVRFGFYGASMVTALFLAAYFMFKKISNRWILALGIVLLIGLLCLAYGWFLWVVSISSLLDSPFKS